MRVWLRDQWYQIKNWRDSLDLARSAVRDRKFSMYWGREAMGATPGVWITWYDGPLFTINLFFICLCWTD